MSMFDLTKVIVESIKRPGNSTRGVENGVFVMTKKGEDTTMKIVKAAKRKALEFAKYSAKEVAAVAVDLMITGIDDGAKKVMAGAPNAMLGFEQGMFKMASSDADIPFTLADGGGAGSIVFNPLPNAAIEFKGDVGAYGKFFESFFYGITGNEAFPDLALRGAQYGRIIEYLAPELKVTGGSPVAGSKRVPPESVTRTSTTEASRDVNRVVTSADWAEGAKMGLNKGQIQKRNAELAKQKVKQSGLEVVIKKEVNALVMTAIGVVKLLQKMAALMIIETDKTTGSHITNAKARIAYFQFVSAKIYAKLNVDEIMKAAFPATGGSNPNNKFFRIDVKEDTQTLFVDKDGKGNYIIEAATLEVNVKGFDTKTLSGEVSQRTYMDSYSLWSDKTSRNAFFTAMYQLNKTNSLFAIAKPGSPQADFNKQMGAASARMAYMLGKVGMKGGVRTNPKGY
jgi:hypothetical protein